MEPRKWAKYSKSLDLGPFKIEPHKWAKYSKSLDPDEMDEDSDEELEDRDKVVESRVQTFSSSEDEDDAKGTKVVFWTTRARNLSNFMNFTGPPNGVNWSAASNIWGAADK